MENSGDNIIGELCAAFRLRCQRRKKKSPRTCPNPAATQMDITATAQTYLCSDPTSLAAPSMYRDLSLLWSPSGIVLLLPGAAAEIQQGSCARRGLPTTTTTANCTAIDNTTDRFLLRWIGFRAKKLTVWLPSPRLSVGAWRRRSEDRPSSSQGSLCAWIKTGCPRRQGR